MTGAGRRAGAIAAAAGLLVLLGGCGGGPGAARARPSTPATPATGAIPPASSPTPPEESLAAYERVAMQNGLVQLGDLPAGWRKTAEGGTGTTIDPDFETAAANVAACRPVSAQLQAEKRLPSLLSPTFAGAVSTGVQPKEAKNQVIAYPDSDQAASALAVYSDARVPACLQQLGEQLRARAGVPEQAQVRGRLLKVRQVADGAAGFEILIQIRSDPRPASISLVRQFVQVARFLIVYQVDLLSTAQGQLATTMVDRSLRRLQETLSP